MCDQTITDLLKKAGRERQGRQSSVTNGLLSELSAAGFSVKSAGRTAASFSIDPYHLPNAWLFHRMAGRPSFPQGKMSLVLARGKGDQVEDALTTESFKRFGRDNARTAIKSGEFSGILARHGFGARLSGHKVVLERRK